MLCDEQQITGWGEVGFQLSDVAGYFISPDMNNYVSGSPDNDYYIITTFKDGSIKLLANDPKVLKAFRAEFNRRDRHYISMQSKVMMSAI